MSATTAGCARAGFDCDEFDGGQGRRRSVDLRFFRPALYQLSYLTQHRTPLRGQVGGHDGI